MKNARRFTKILLAFIMMFTLFGNFGILHLRAAGVTISSQTVTAGLGVTEVTFNVNVQAGTTVQNAWVTMSGMTATVFDQTLLAGHTFTSPTSVAITVAVIVDEEHLGNTFVGQVYVSHSEGTSSGFLTVNVGATPTPSPTPTPAETPIISMSAPTSYIEMTPGISSIVNVTLQNTSRFMARDFRITPRVDANFTVEILGDLPSFNLGQNATRTFQLRITPHSGLDSGTHTIVFDYSFENNVRNVITQQGNVVARVYRPTPDEPRVVMADFVLSPMLVNAGDNFQITTTLRNTSSASAANVQLSIGGFAEDGLISQGSTTNFVGSLSANTTRDVAFSFGTPANMTTGSHPITFTLRYDNAAGEVVTENFTFYVTIMGDGAGTETDRSRLTITNISSPAGIFSPNDEVNFSITIQNTGERDATNVRISADPESGVVPRLASIQTLPTLAVGQSHTFSFAFSPTSSAQSQFHNIGFEIAYDTGQINNGNPVRGGFEQFAGFNVYNPDADDDVDDTNRSVPRIIISDYTINSGNPDQPMIVMANSEFDLTLTMLNTHSERTIGNIRVTWEVSAITVGNEITGGNVFTPVDSSNTFFIDTIPPRGIYEHHMRLFAIPDAAPRNHVITINFEYEDAEGNPFDATESIGVNVRQESRLEMSIPSIPTVVTEGDRISAEVILLNAGRSTLFNLRVRLEGEGITPHEEVFGNVQSGHFNNSWAQIFAVQSGPSTIYIIATFDDEMGQQHTVTETVEIEILSMMDFGGWDDGGFGDWNGGGGDFGFWGEEGFGEDGGFLTNIWFWVAIGGGLIAVTGVTILLVRRRKKFNDEFGLDDDDLA
ncbi:MAG: hypothetical protein FWE34_00425 [Defluviitaleaceae bacterium]|nr:hypothetical protein [Defluviitaleaceae bacterium]